MSSPCHILEFQKLYQTHLAAFSLADGWQRSDALNQLLVHLRRLSYLTVTKAAVTTKNNPMIELTGKFSLAKRLPELVQVDLAHIWADASVCASHAFHTFNRTSYGFDGVFLAVHDGAVVTYHIRVIGTH